MSERRPAEPESIVRTGIGRALLAAVMLFF
jgi:hypothetical protein